MVNLFAYSKSIINALERALSPERLSTYLAAAHGDHAAALRLYVWNTEVSAALYGPLQALEIVVRNAFHRELAAVYGAAWYDHPQVPLTPFALARVADAKDALAPCRTAPRSGAHRRRTAVRILGAAADARAARQAQLRDGAVAPCPAPRLSELSAAARRRP
jgi:hypothetical protein